MTEITHVLYWEDPDEADNAMNRGFESFLSEKGMLCWLKHKVKTAPDVSCSAFSVANKLEIVAVETVTEFKVKK